MAQRAISKKSGKVYLVSNPVLVGTKEDNEKKSNDGKFYFSSHYGETSYDARIEKNGKSFGRVRGFFSSELTFIN